MEALTAMWTKLPMVVLQPPMRKTKSSMMTASPREITSGVTIFARGQIVTSWPTRANGSAYAWLVTDLSYSLSSRYEHRHGSYRCLSLGLADQARVPPRFQTLKIHDLARPPFDVADLREPGFVQASMKLFAVVEPLMAPPAKRDIEHLRSGLNELDVSETAQLSENRRLTCRSGCA